MTLGKLARKDLRILHKNGIRFLMCSGDEQTATKKMRRSKMNYVLCDRSINLGGFLKVISVHDTFEAAREADHDLQKLHVDFGYPSSICLTDQPVCIGFWIHFHTGKVKKDDKGETLVLKMRSLNGESERVIDLLKRVMFPCNYETLSFEEMVYSFSDEIVSNLTHMIDGIFGATGALEDYIQRKGQGAIEGK